MRLSNKRKMPLYRFFYTFLMLVLGISCAIFLLDYFKFDRLGTSRYVVIGIPIIFFALFIKRGKQIFEYDSDGEALNFINKSVVPFFSKTKLDEFPKYKLIKYDVLNGYLFKNLYITITSKKTKSITLKYDISYLTKKEVKDLKLSLNRVIKKNRENKMIKENK